MDTGFTIKAFEEADPSLLERDDNETRVSRAFLITDATFPDPRMAMCIAMQMRVPGSGTIKNVNGVIDHTIVRHVRDLMDAVPKDERFMLVIDLTPFPYFIVAIHRGEPEKGDDTFSKNVHRVWSTYDMTKEIPVIVVNVELSFTGLKLLPLH